MVCFTEQNGFVIIELSMGIAQRESGFSTSLENANVVHDREVIETRIKQNAQEIYTVLVRMGDKTIDIINNLGKGRALNPIYLQKWKRDEFDLESEIDIPEDITSILSRLAKNIPVSWEEIAPLQTYSDGYFAALFVGPLNPAYLSSGAANIHPIAQQLDRDLREKYPELMRLDLDVQERVARAS